MEDVVCFACGGAEPGSGNDILLCDFAGCGRAFHQLCHVPPVERFPAEEEDWTCAQVGHKLKMDDIPSEKLIVVLLDAVLGVQRRFGADQRLSRRSSSAFILAYVVP